MTTTKMVKRSVTILALTGILVITPVFGLVMFLPAAYAAEEFECIYCYAGSHTLLHYGKGLATLSSGKVRGIIMSKSDNKFLDNSAAYQEWLQVGWGMGGKGKGYVLFKIIDPDGDIIIGEYPYTGLKREVKFLQGSGKYKGIKGSYITQQILVDGEDEQRLQLELRKRLEGFGPITYRNCRSWKGTFELPK